MVGLWWGWSLAVAVGPAGPSEEPALPSLEPLQVQSIEGWTFERYAQALSDVCERTGRGVELAAHRLQSIPDPTRTDVRRWFREVDQYLVEGEKAARVFPTFEADPGLRDAVADMFVTFRGLWEGNVDEQLALLERAEVRNADLARMEVLQRGFTESVQQLNGRFFDAQVAVAARHQVTLLPPEPPPPPPERPTFRTPTVPPAGSGLTGEVHVGFAVRYLNRLIDGQNRIIGALNRALQTDGTVEVRERRRADAVKAITAELAALRGVEDWQGDAAARDAVVASGERIVALLDGYGEVLRLEGAKRPTQAEVDAANARITAMNEGLQRVEEDWRAATAAFRTRWGVEDWEAWSAANPGPTPP